MKMLGHDYEADRFDVAHALHHYCMDYHSGAGSRLYQLGCKLSSIWRYRDAPGCEGLIPHLSGENDISILIYEDLVAGKAGQ